MNASCQGQNRQALLMVPGRQKETAKLLQTIIFKRKKEQADGSGRHYSGTKNDICQIRGAVFCMVGTVKRYCTILIISMCILLCIPGCSVVRRAEYRLSGAGLTTWEDAAWEAGIPMEVEEYHYRCLPEELKETYREMYVHIMKNEDQGDLYSRVSVEDFWEAYYAVLNDHPEIFWIGNSAQISELALTGRVISYELETTVPKEERESMRLKLEAAANECTWGIAADASDYEKIKYVYEYIIDSTEYDGEAENSQNIQSVLLHCRSVCAGYSRTFQYLMHRMGLFCTYVTGRIRGGGDHAWNMVRIDGNYYYVDVTWGDPVFLNQVEGTPDRGMNYNYLCCTEQELFLTHVPADFPPLPDCVSEDYNYYKRTGNFYDTFDYDTLYDRLMESVRSGDTVIVLKFQTEEGYQQAVKELFEGDLLQDAGQYLMRLNGVTSWNYRYRTDEEFYVITLYWY